MLITPGVVIGNGVVFTPFVGPPISGFTEPTSVGSGYSLYTIAVNSSGLFVAAGQSDVVGYPIYSTSSNGSSWSAPSKFSGYTPGNAAFFNSIIWNPIASLFIATGVGPTGNSSLYTTSANGSTWATPAQMNGSSYVFQAFGMAVNSSGLTVAIGVGDTVSYPNFNNYSMYATSTNGTTWTTPARVSGSTTTHWLRGIAVNSSGLFVSVGVDFTTNSATRYPIYSTSTNGSNWTTPSTMNGSTTVAYMNGVAWSPTLNLFVAVGGDASGDAVYATSTNGSTWTTPAYMNGQYYGPEMKSVVWSPALNLFVAVGSSASGNVPFYYYSSNGSTWSTRARMGSSSAMNIFGSGSLAVNNSGKFVAVGSVSGVNGPAYSTSY